MSAIEQCSARSGGTCLRCEACEQSSDPTNSCRNRHCPKCRPVPRAALDEARQGRDAADRVLPVVFTLPADDTPSSPTQNKP